MSHGEKKPRRIRLMVVDDHPIVRQGVVKIIADEPDMEVVAEAGSGEQAIELHRQHQPDVTLMDLRLPGIGGVEAIRKIREASPGSRFIVLTTYDGDEDIYRALEAGAQSFVLKDTFVDEILQTIRAVHAGQQRLSGPVAQKLSERIHHSELTPREVEVLRLIASGESNKDIAASLGITEGTVKSHVVSIIGKLGVTDRTSAATVALRRGIIRL